MDEKTNFYVFAKKEIALIFLFMLIIAVTSFVLGVKVGKSYNYDAAGFTEEDRENISMNSRSEETVKDMVKKDERTEEDKKLKRSEVLDSTYKQLEEEFEKLDEKVNKDKKKAPPAAKAPVKAAPEITKKKEVPQVMVKEETHDFPELNAPMPEASLRDQYSGKFTIQLGSYQSLRDAESFADGFRIRGYKPIINEVDIKKRGIWYRVSLGIFESVGKAKDYVLREKTLFKGQDYVIGKFD
ncbi:MAG: SPOR domain-containing protein [Bdellovibrionota bacterium]|nr:SPOR domain-containing protein [Bdellovibrionota bacterium]